MWFSDFVTPITSTNGNDRQFGQNDGSTDSSGHFFTAFDAKPYVSVIVTDCHKRLETSSLTGSGLLLDRHYLQYFVFKLWSNKEVNDFELFDRKRESVDLF